MVFYALVSSTSVGALFLAGILPGVLMTIVLMVAVAIMPPAAATIPSSRPWRRRDLPHLPAGAAADVLMPVPLLGGIYSGRLHPDGAGGLAGLYALLLSALFIASLA